MLKTLNKQAWKRGQNAIQNSRENISQYFTFQIYISVEYKTYSLIYVLCKEYKTSTMDISTKI